LIYGLEKVDPKLRRIAELNELMAYTPWEINQSHFVSLIKEGASPDENWSVHEVLKAGIVLATYHGMCGLCQGMGLLPDRDIVDELLIFLGSNIFDQVATQDF